MTNIILLKTSLLEGHPKNPRKDIGDISELTESIRANGIMQNLTVVPWASAHPDAAVNEVSKNEGRYTLIIGHRRFNAAKAAGVEEVPCVISNMSYKEQLGCMMTENLQRADLTAIEQAEGFQLMLDLGDSVADIAKQTGFSETTVRRRVKLMELGKEQLAKFAKKQITFEEVESLDKIKDEKKRSEVMKSLGTKNFKNEYEKALQAQEQVTRLDEWKQCLAEMPNFTEITAKVIDGSKYKHVANFNCFTMDICNLEKYQNGEFFYYFDYGNWVYLRRAATDEEIKEDKEKNRRDNAKSAEREARCAKLRACEERFRKLRLDFIKEYPEKKAIENLSILVKYLEESLHGYINPFKSAIEGITTPGKRLLSLLYSATLSGSTCTYYYDGKFSVSKKHDEIYALLEKLGYETSDEEMEFYSGESELYLKG